MVLVTPAYELGGAERITKQLSERIPNCYLVCLYRGREKSLNYPNNVKIVINAKPPRSIALKICFSIYAVLWLSLFFVRVKASYVQSHVHFVTVLVYFASLFCPKKLKRDCVIHGRLTLEQEKSRLYFKLLKSSYLRARRNICVSKGLFRELQKYKIPNGIVIYNGVLENKTLGEKSDFKKAKKLRFLILGRLEKVKNVGLIFRALQDKNVTLDIMGNGSQIENLKRLSQNVKCEVNYLGYVPNPNELMHMYDALINSSKSETFSLSILEALVNGLPVISSNCQFGPQEIFDIPLDEYANIKGIRVIGTVGILFKNGCGNSLLEAVEHFSCRKEEFFVPEAKICEFRQRFSSEKMVEKYKSLIV